MTSDAQPSAEQSADPALVQTSVPAQPAPRSEPQTARDSDAAPHMADDGAELTELQAEVEALKEQLAARDAALAEKDALIDSLRQQTASQPPSGTSSAEGETASSAELHRPLLSKHLCPACHMPRFSRGPHARSGCVPCDLKATRLMTPLRPLRRRRSA